MRWKPWPVRSEAAVTFLLGEKAAALRITQRLLRQTLRRWEYAGLGGAPDSGQVDVGELHGALYLEVRDPLAAAYRGYFYLRHTAGHLVLCNEGLSISSQCLRARGWGLQMFYRQVRNAVAIGIDRIELRAGRRRGENGYYTWPRFGFDGALTPTLRAALPDRFRTAKTVLDLIETREGRAWWREHGETIDVCFDLTPGSRSRRTLRRYVVERMAKAVAQKEILKARSACRIVTRDEHARHNQRQRNQGRTA